MAHGPYVGDQVGAYSSGMAKLFGKPADPAPGSTIDDRNIGFDINDLCTGLEN